MKHHRTTKTVERLKTAFRPILTAIDTPLARHAKKLLKENDWNALAQLSTSPQNHSSATSYFWDAQVCALFSKNETLPTTIDRKAVARKGFLEAERHCRETNDYLSDLLYSGPTESTRHIFEMLERARSVCCRILGSAPSIGQLKGRYGPGASNDVKSREPRSNKYGYNSSATKRLSDILSQVECGPGTPLKWRSPDVIFESEKIITVSKNAKTDRTIGIPVSLNGFFQLAVGEAIRDKLDRFRRHALRETQDIHRALLSGDHQWCTIDLKAASDTVTFMLVRWLLPDDWLSLLLAVRVDNYQLDQADPVAYEKFSAMGNGATFELETLIFYAVCLAAGVSRSMCTTYGDDIIVPRCEARNVIGALESAGFLINREKTFLSGRFYESCGADFFDGVDVRPFFVRKLRHTQDFILLANGIRNIMATWDYGLRGDFASGRFRDSWMGVVDLIPRGTDLLGSASYGDQCIHCEREEIRTDKRVRARRRGLSPYRTYRYLYTADVLWPLFQSFQLDRWLYERGFVDGEVDNLTYFSDPLSPSLDGEEIRGKGKYRRVAGTFIGFQSAPVWIS